MISVAVIGAGYWGPNLIRNFSACPGARLAAVCDRDEARLKAVLARYPGVEAINDVDELLSRGDIDAVAIATPVRTHAPLGVAALEAGKHVLIEKPLASSVREAEALVKAARAQRRTLMVDHTFIYSPAVKRIKEIVDSGDLGELLYIDSVRINLGLFQPDINVVWDLAPHDLAILDYVLGRAPHSVFAFGAAHAGHEIGLEDVAWLNLDYGDGLVASCHVNWLSPVKVRHFIIGGSNKSIVYNDLEGPEKVKVYDRGITVSEHPEQKRGVMVGYRTGDIWSPHLDQSEPLQNMVRHFVECIETGRQPITDGEAGLRTVRLLEAAQRNIKSAVGRTTLTTRASRLRAA
jgi:predicted dehydrogenase